MLFTRYSYNDRLLVYPILLPPTYVNFVMPQLPSPGQIILDALVDPNLCMLCSS